MERCLGATDQRTGRDSPEYAQIEDHCRPAQPGSREAEEQRRRSCDQQHARAYALEHVPDDEHRRARRSGRQHRADDQGSGVCNQEPALRQQLRQLHREHCADGIAGVGQAGPEAERLRGRVQLRGDDRRQRLHGGRQAKVRNEEKNHHSRGGAIPPGQRPWLEWLRPLRRRAGRRRTQQILIIGHSRMLAGWLPGDGAGSAARAEFAGYPRMPGMST
jgi:hypothetical protein